MITLEFHCHTNASPDSQVEPAELVATCRARGIQRVVITDHWSIAGARQAQALDPELVIVGEEVLTDRGELLCAFVTEAVPRGTPYREAIAQLRAQGAFISVSHPFDPRRGIWRRDELEELANLVDAFETFNARIIAQRYNQAAARFAAEHGLPGTAGSDAHTAGELGRAVMRLPEFNDAESLRAALRQAEFQVSASSPWVRVASRWARVTKKLWGRA